MLDSSDSRARRTGDDNILLFTNPRGPSRSNLTLRLSRDDGKTWSMARTITGDLAGYSDLGVLPDRTILCIWEGGTQRYHDKITVARFNLDWLLAGEAQTAADVGHRTVVG